MDVDPDIWMDSYTAAQQESSQLYRDQVSFNLASDGDKLTASMSFMPLSGHEMVDAVNIVLFLYQYAKSQGYLESERSDN